MLLKAPCNLVKDIFSFETFFVLFLFSYQFKNAYPFCLVPDLTLLSMAALVPWFLIFYRKNHATKLLTTETVSFLLFSLWGLISTFWVEHTTYTISKALCFGIYTVPAFFMAYFIIGMNDERLKRFLIAIIALSIWVHLEAYKEFILSGWQIVDVLGNNYLVTGQTLGFGFILLTLFSFFILKESATNNETLNNKFLFWFLLILCGTYTYIQLHLGGRGPVLGVILTLLYFYIDGIYKGESRLYIMHFLYFSLSCGLIYAFFSWVFKTETCHFLLRTYESHSDESITLRLEYYGSAISAFLKYPLTGLGLGGWALFHDTLYHYTPIAHDLREVLWRHPHNIGLEVLSETGLVGGLLGLWLGLLIFKKIPFRLLSHSFLDAAPTLLLAFSLFNTLKSGDLNDNILFFVMAGIIAAREKTETQIPNN